MGAFATKPARPEAVYRDAAGLVLRVDFPRCTRHEAASPRIHAPAEGPLTGEK